MHAHPNCITKFFFSLTDYVKILQSLLKSKRTVNVQYLQLCFIGSPKVGKTTTRNRLLTLHCSLTECQNTPVTVAKYNQTLAFVNKNGKWLPTKGVKEEPRWVVHFFENSLMPLAEELSIAGCNNATVSAQISSSRELPQYEVPAVQQTMQPSSKLEGVIDRLKLLIKNGDCSKVRSLLDSTLLNVHDIGGQLGFLQMLPALIHGPAMYLLCFNMSKDFDSGTASEHSTRTTIFKVLSSIASIQCLPCKPSSLKIENMPEFSEKFEEFQKICPTVALIGTHLDKVTEDFEEKCTEISKALIEMTRVFERLSVMCNGSRVFFPVNNLEGNDTEGIEHLRHFISTYFVSKFEHVTLPIQPNWLLFGIVLRNEYHIVTVSDCLEIGKILRMNESEVKVCLWYLHYCVGTLIYYPDLPDQWFKHHVICSPQVVFNSVDKLILRVLCPPGGDCCLPFLHDRINWTEKGQFSIDSLSKCMSSEVKDELKNKKLIEIERLVELLKYINLLSPINSESDNQITYLMPAILECVPQMELTNYPPLDVDSPEPLFIKFKCEYVPTGLFCGLITRLVSLSGNKIFGVEWKLEQKGVKQNRVSFIIYNVHKVTLLSHDDCFEVRLVREVKDDIELHELCRDVLSVLLYTLDNKVSPIIAFQCQCRKVKFLDKSAHQHLCVLSRSNDRVQYLCENSIATLSNSQRVWIGKVINMVSYMC